MKKYLIIILCTISGISFAQLPLKTFEKSSAPNMFIGVDATDSLAQWKPLSGIGYSTLADSSKWTQDTYLYPKDLTKKVGIGIATPSQQLEITESFETPATTSSTTGVWYKGALRFAHNYQHPTGQSAAPSGANTFIGEQAGNFTMGTTATSTDHSSSNTGIGKGVLFSNTLGYGNVAIGVSVLGSNTTGYYNVGNGVSTLFSNTTGYQNMGIGFFSLYGNTTGYNNIGIGYAALRHNTTQYENMAFGAYSAFNAQTNGSIFFGYNAGRQGTLKTVGNYTIVLGYDAGKVLGTGENNLLFGKQVELALPNTHNQLNIGNAIYATGLGTGSTPSATAAVGIGTSTPATQFHTTGSVRLAGLTASTETAAVMIKSDGDLSKRTLNAAAFNGTIDSTALTAGYGIDVSEAGNNWTVKADTVEVTTPYGVSQMISDSLATLSFGDTQDLSIDSTGRVFTIALTDGGSVKFRDIDTDTNTTYSAGYGLALNGTTFSNTKYWKDQDTVKTTLTGLLKSTSGVLSAITDGSANWNTAYNDKINSLAFSGTTTKTLTLTQQDGGTVTNTFTDIDTDTKLTEEEVEDYVGGMVTGNTETGITVTYQDADGTIDFINDGVTSFNGSTGAITYAGVDETGTNAANQISYFTDDNTITSSSNLYWNNTGGILQITNSAKPRLLLRSLAETGQRYTLAVGSLTQGLMIYPSSSTPTMPISIMKADSTTKAFVFKPSDGSIGLGSTANQGTAGQAIISQGSGNAVVWGNPVATLTSSIEKYRKSGSQTFSSTSFTKIDLGSVLIDNNMVAVSTANKNFTVSQTGYYEITIVFNLQSNTAGSYANPLFALYDGETIINTSYGHKTDTTQGNNIVTYSETLNLIQTTSVISVRTKATSGVSYNINDFTITVKRVY